MGQVISVAKETVVGDVVVFDTDRSITGQDGTGFASPESATGDDFAARLAARLFAEVKGVDHVFIASSQVVARNSAGWKPAAVKKAAEVVSNFFVFYNEA